MGKLINFIKKYWITTLLFLGLIMGYVLLTRLDLVDAFLFPKPDRIVKSFVENRKLMFENIKSSLKLLFPSIGLALLLSLALGIVLGINRKLREILLPVIYTISVVPAILLSPFALLLAPDFYSASIFLIVYSTMWPTVFATINGIVTIDKRYLDTAKTLEIKGLKKMVRVVLPAAMPSILSGFISSLRGSFQMLVFAEMYGAKFGVGNFIQRYASYGIYENVWSGFIVMVVLLVVVLRVFELVKERLLRWTIDQ